MSNSSFDDFPRPHGSSQVHTPRISSGSTKTIYKGNLNVILLKKNNPESDYRCKLSYLKKK